MKEDERYYAERIGKAQQEIQTHNAIITGTKLEMLKHHGMVDTQKEAEQMMEQTSKDIVATLVAEGKEHVEEEFEEKVEQAKEEAEKREELQEVKDMMQKMKLIEEDVKGAAVDQSL